MHVALCEVTWCMVVRCKKQQPEMATVSGGTNHVTTKKRRKYATS